MTDRVEKLTIYLKQARVNAEGADAVAIVIGNEAADLDSMVSAILHGQLASASGAPDGPPVVPVANCPRGDFDGFLGQAGKAAWSIARLRRVVPMPQGGSAGMRSQIASKATRTECRAANMFFEA